MINPHYLAKRRKELNFNDINYLFFNNNYFLIIFFLKITTQLIIDKKHF